MEKQYRIHWKKGLDITPEIFINSDNYHISERHLLARFIASHSYGILPNGKFTIEKDLVNNRVVIQHLECLAITSGGYISNIQNDTSFQKELALNETQEGAFYVVLTANASPTTCIDEKELYMFSEYNLTLTRTDKTIQHGLPIAKIYNNNSHWEMDKGYIPPAIALSSVAELKERFSEIKKIIHEILEKFSEKDPYYLQVMMFQLELNNYSLQESPEELSLLLKKFCWIFQAYLNIVEKMGELPAIKAFIDEPYNPNEIGKILQLGLDALKEVHQILYDKPIPVEIEEINV